MKKISLVVGILLAFTMCVSSVKAAPPDTIKARIEKGLVWLKMKQNVDGSWGNNYQVGKTGLAVKKFENYAIERGINPLDTTSWPQDTNYYHQVKYGLNYLFKNASIVTPLPVQTHDGNLDDPDTDGDGKGVTFAGGRTYETGIALMTIAESNCPDSVVDVPTSPVNGWTYDSVAVNAMNWLAYAQVDFGIKEGGWYYWAVSNGDGSADQSNSGYATLGLAFAETPLPHGFSLDVPSFVTDELGDPNLWIDYIQYANGGSGYGYGPNLGDTSILETGNLLFEMAWYGDPITTQRVQDAIAYIARNWHTTSNNSYGWPAGWLHNYAHHNYQGMYTMMKGVEAYGIVTIPTTPNPTNWFDEVSDTIVHRQNDNGSWGPCYWDNHATGYPPDSVLSTCWALLTLEKVTIHVVPHGTVEIPNKVYERFGYAHWDYIWPQDSSDTYPVNDNCIVFDEACPGWAGINPGDYFEIPIILRDFALKIGGFELEVDFDYIDLTFYGAERGGLLEKRLIGPNPIPWQDDIFWSWEYFSYRVLPCPTCACCKYKILLYGQAEMPDGPFRRGYCISSGYAGEDSLWWYMDKVKAKCPDGAVIDSVATLVWLKFQVANNELLRDLKLPIVFEWEHKLHPDSMRIIQDWDCAENTFSNCDGSLLYVSKDSVLQYDPHVCPNLPADQRILDFIDGGVHICSPCTAFTCVRGDINKDEVPYSTADAVLFARYFVYGLGVFTIDRDVQVCATDINADGRTLMLADLIYLIRVIQKDAVEFPKLGPSSDVVNVIVSDGRITVECASAIGGILFKFDGAVTPTLFNNNMELLSNEGNVLVWSGAGNSINAGASQLLTASGELVSVIAVDRDGRELATTINAKVTPTTFALHSAYPNPFNPNTNLSFTLPTAVSYSLNVYNVAGQLVRSYEGMGDVGLNVIIWDGKDNAGDEVASGIYFYKLIAGQHQATRKMVILK